MGGCWVLGLQTGLPFLLSGLHMLGSMKRRPQLFFETLSLPCSGRFLGPGATFSPGCFSLCGLVESLQNNPPLLLPHWVTNVHHVEENISAHQLIKGCLKGGEQRKRETLAGTDIEREARTTCSTDRRQRTRARAGRHTSYPVRILRSGF